MSGFLDSAQTTAFVIFVFAMVQIVVHVCCFLHVDSRAEDGWMLLAFIFTAIIVGITIIGSIWVMYHLNANMMPMSFDGISQTP
jgi:cytochrome o ubiquinol oxidase operon protein cyoD